MSSKDQLHLLAKFFTKEKRYSIPDNPFSIPSASSPTELNGIIKSFLKDSVEDEEILKELDLIEFDFIFNNEILQTTLEDYLNHNPHIKTESVLEIEYVLQFPPPEPVNSLTLSDWVSCVRGYDNLILAASYDHTVQLWDINGELLVILPGHNGAVKAVSWVPSNTNNEIYKFISASHDQTLMIWQWNKNKNSIENVKVCIGHQESVECVDTDPTSTKFISGSWDTMLKLWSLLDEPMDNLEIQSSKSNKTTPLITLAGHTQNISSCKWMDEINVCTASWDHTIRLWDMHSAQEKCTLSNNSKIFLSIDYSSLNNLIIAGLSDRHVRLYDPRSVEGSIVKSTFTSHTGWCSSVFWSKTNQNVFVSGSYDNLVKLWDIRSPKSPLYDISGHEDKIFCVDWSLKSHILSGSADNTIKIFKSST